MPRHGAPAEWAVSPRNEVLDRHQPGSRPVAPRHPQLVADVREHRDVDVLEKPFPHEVGLGPEQLLGRARPDPDRARQLLALHDLLHRDRRGDVHRLPGVVSLAVARRALDQRIVIRHAGFLRRLRNPVDVRPERDHRLPGSPGRHERGRNAGDAFFDGKAVLLQDIDQVAMRFLLLEAQLTVAEDLIDHLLREHRHAVHCRRGFGLEPIDARIGLRGRRRRRGLRTGRGDQHRDDKKNHTASGC